MSKKILSALILLISSFTTPLYADEASISIENAWIAEAPPASKTMVAYMTIKNTGNKTVTITKAECGLFSNLEFHESTHKNGTAKMIRHDEIKIPPHKSVQLKQGGKHLMLFNPKQSLKTGDRARMKLTTKSHDTKTIVITVKKATF
ncbi:hypothetical protein MNBD_GAMMA06-1083 [hydrothermal vent metagenome]|uniref:Copper metallochaperone, bacterial analog of Cox17 protein n=1 Tax=hydrothermal vent metagenome TaxID=652676 RepID=A0A3B0WFN9_9ZZZZ